MIVIDKHSSLLAQKLRKNTTICSRQKSIWQFGLNLIDPVGNVLKLFTAAIYSLSE